MKQFLLVSFLVGLIYTPNSLADINITCAWLMKDVQPEAPSNSIRIHRSNKSLERSFVTKTNAAEIQSTTETLNSLFSHHLKTAVNGNVDSPTTQKLEHNFVMAISEIITNAEKYGNQKNPNKKIHIRVTVKDRAFKVEIADESGRFFDPNNPNDPGNKMRFAKEDDILRIDEIQALRKETNHDPDRPEGDGGRGIQITEALADEIVFSPFKNGREDIIGTKVTMTWYLPEN